MAVVVAEVSGLMAATMAAEMADDAREEEMMADGRARALGLGDDGCCGDRRCEEAAMAMAACRGGELVLGSERESGREVKVDP